MAEVGEVASALGWYLSGARYAGARQDKWSASLGGYISNVRADVVTAQRLNAVRGVRIDYVSGGAGPTLGTLIAEDADTLSWQPSGAAARGTSVAIANGETKVLPGPTGYADYYLIVTRTSATALAGRETLQGLENFGGVVGGGILDVDNTVRHLGGYLVNDGSGTMTGIAAWVEDGDTIDFGSEAELQVIADAETAPTGISWNHPESEGAAVSLGSLAAGAHLGLWVRRLALRPPATPAASGHVANAVWVKYTSGGVTYRQRLGGLTRVRDASIPEYALFIGFGAARGPEDGAANATGSALPLTYTGVIAEGTWYARLYRRNAFGLYALENEKVWTVDDEGTATERAPLEPEYVAVGTTEGGKALVTSAYYPAREGTTAAEVGLRRANQWAVYLGYGADPVVGVTTPEVENMPGWATTARTKTGREALRYVGAAVLLDRTPVHALVRTRRNDGTAPVVDSENTTVVTGTINRIGPGRVGGRASYGGVYGVAGYGIDAPDEVQDVDDGGALRWVLAGGENQLCWGDGTILRVIYDSGDTSRNGIYLVNPWRFVQAEITGSMMETDEEIPQEYALESGTNLMYVGVRGERRLEFNLDSKTVRAKRFVFKGVTSESAGAGALWPRWPDTCFQIWDQATAAWWCYAAVEFDGDFTAGLRVVQNLDETEVLAI